MSQKQLVFVALGKEKFVPKKLLGLHRSSASSHEFESSRQEVLQQLIDCKVANMLC